MRYGVFNKRVAPTGSWLVSGAVTSAAGQWWFKGTIHKPDGTLMDLTKFKGRLTVGLPLTRPNGRITPRSYPTDGSPSLRMDMVNKVYQSLDIWLFTKEVTIAVGTDGVFEVTVFAADIPDAVSPTTQALFNFAGQAFSTWTREPVVPQTVDAQGLHYLLPYSVALWNVVGVPSIKLYPLYGLLEVDPSLPDAAQDPFTVLPTS